MGDFNRRTVLAGATLAATGGVALAQAPARQKGPLVWLDMDQQELDDAYDQSKYAANLAQIVKRYATNSEQVRARLGAPKRLAYGATPVEGLDLYPTRKQNAPVHVFIHGGAWRSGLARDSAYQAETFVHAGAHYIAVDFNNVVETKGDLAPMADQVRRAVAWVYRNATSFGGDPNRIFRFRAFLRRAPRRCRAGDRLAEGFRPAAGRREGRAGAAPACSTSSRRGSRRGRAMSSSPTRSSTRCRRSATCSISTVR